MTTPYTCPMPTLAAAHHDALAASAINEAIMAERGYTSIAPGSLAAWRALTGPSLHADKLLKQVLHAGAMAFPVYRCGTATPYTWVLRPDLPRSDAKGKPIKYEWPRLTPPVFDVLPRFAEGMGDPSRTLWLTEGAKKADALATLYGESILPINMNGVYGWRGTNAAGGKTALVDFELIAWEGRRVILAPDGDIRHNKGVQQATQRLAALLTGRYGVAEVLVLHLPSLANGPKIGVDDYLAQGHDANALESLLTTMATVTSTAMVPLLTHPDTQAKVFLPPGYSVHNANIVQATPRGEPRHIYSGAIYVRSLGVDLATGEQTATIHWNGRGEHHGERTIPYAALSDTKTFSSLVGSAGAAVHPRNIKDVQALLVEFTQANIDALPRETHSERLGVIGTGLVTPAGAVGFREAVRYTGQPALSIGDDAAAYPQALAAAVATMPDAWPLWLTLGLSLAAPALARMRPRRYPVMYLSGDSGSGKTTVTQFAVGCWGNPNRQPLRMEAGRSPPAAIFQSLEHLGGLPLFIDDAHAVPEPKRIEMAAYAFANGQRYTVGGPDGKTRGGGELGGALFLAGEAIPEFKHAGSRLRVLWGDANATLPLGAEAAAQSTEGQRRALLLETAWERGAGRFGYAVAQAIWGDWAAFTADVAALAGDEALVPLGAWTTPLAAAAAALNVAFRVANVGALPPSFEHILSAWATMLTHGRDETDPATDAWEALLTMLTQGRRYDDAQFDEEAGKLPTSATWEWLEADRGGGMIACRKVGDAYLRVPTSTPQFNERVGKAAVQLHGQTWLRRNWLLFCRDGKATEPMKTPDGTLLRMLKVPVSAITGWQTDEVTP